jgi:hypothetical protein
MLISDLLLEQFDATPLENLVVSRQEFPHLDAHRPVAHTLSHGPETMSTSPI